MYDKITSVKVFSHLSYINLALRRFAMKKYIAPEYKNETIEVEDIITTSNFIFNGPDENGNAVVEGNLGDLLG